MSKFLQVSVFFLSFILQGQYIFAQAEGIISGKIIDAKSGEAIIGANIILEGTTIGAASDLDGNYSLKNISVGKYNIIVSYISYTKTTAKEVVVTNNTNTVVNISLKPEAIEFSEEVVVTAERSEQYEAALLNKRKNSTQISDGISAEQIKRSTDNTTAEALRRVPGLTLLDNKYIYIRGVSERYNGALLNNSPLASSEPDKKDFAFDLIPSSLIENTIVIKSFTPEEPGDFSGGLVKVNTVEFPSQTIFSFNYSTSYVYNVSTKSYNTYEGSNTDALGFDDGFRDLPAGFPDAQTYKNYDFAFNDTNRTYWSTKLNDKWGIKNNKAFLDQSFGLTYGDRFTLFGNDFGLIGSLNYKNGFNNRDIITRDIESNENGTYFFDYKGVRSTNNIFWGGIFNLSYKLADLHKIGFKNIFTVSSDDEVTRLHGFKYDYADERNINALRFVSRNLYSGQLSGASFFPLISGIQVDWRVSYSAALRDEPDYRRNAYRRDIADSNSTVPFIAYIPRDPDFYAGGRFFSYLKEYKRGYGLDLTQDFEFIKIKYGAGFSNSSRSFNARLLSVTDPTGGNASRVIGQYELDSLYSVENFEKRIILMREYFDPANNYTSSDELFSYYIMGEAPFDIFDQRFILIGGFRIENYVLRLRTILGSAFNNAPLFVDNFSNDVLPAFSLIYKLNESSNIRLSFSNTINRPQFREIAPFNYYNFEDQTFTKGNPALKQATIANYDIRFEVFPGIGELISASVFLKELRNPIEKVFVVSTGQNDRTFANSSFAQNIGFELEYRSSLSRVWQKLANFTFSANYSQIWSEIVETNVGVERKTRPMQGQSPYVINLSLNYMNAAIGLSASISYNTFGKRIYETANFQGEDIYEFPRNLFDLVVSKNLWYNIEIKLSIRDLLAEPQEFFEDNILVRQYSSNAKMSLGVSYRL